MTRVVRFERVASVAGLYFAVGDLLPDASRRVAFVPPAAPDRPPVYDLAESWAVPGGVYVFLGARPKSDAKFLESVRRWLAEPGRSKAGVVWVPEPDAAPEDWHAAWIALGVRSAGTAPLAARATLALQNYVVVLDAGCVVALDSDAAAFRVSGAMRLRVEGDSVEELDILEGGVEIELFDVGRLATAFALRAGARNGQTDAEILDIGCRFYFPELEGDGVASLRYPLFDTRQDGFTVQASFDLFAPLEPQRTALRFDASSGPLASFYRSTLGRPVGLTPGDGALLRFAPRPRVAGDASWLTLVPEGSFSLSLDPAQPNLRGGLSGAEWVTPSTGATLTFVTERPAFVPLEASPSDPFGALTDRARTAWVAFTSGADYYAQPDGAGLYGVDPEFPEGIRRFTPVRAGQLPAEPGPDHALPMPPCARLSPAEGARYQELETVALAPVRRAVVFAATPPSAALVRDERAAFDDPEPLITPQGYIATFDAEQAWARLELAHCGDAFLAFTNVSGALRAALLSNQQFVVLSDPAALDGSFTEHRVVIEGWVLDLDPARWAEHGTIAVIKNAPRALGDLAADLGAWTLATELNVAPARTQTRLLEIIADARASRSARESVPANAGHDPDYDWFLDTVVDDPTWNGVLFLDAPVSTDGSSKELDVVIAGIDPARLMAHHLGVGVTQTSGAPPAMQQSSFFGLIRYRDRLPPPTVYFNDALRFQVLELKVAFQNSRIVSFRSLIALTINQLFGARAKQLHADDDVLLLVGSLQRKTSGPAYAFVQQTPTAFELAESLLATVAIDRAEFTAETRTDDKSRDLITAAFTFWGWFGFRQPRATPEAEGRVLDLLSYDCLAFSGLTLRFGFPRADRTNQSFSLDVSTVSFDDSASVVRAGGFASHFPAVPRGMVSVAQADRPAGLGYITVGTPQLQTTAVYAPWYAVVFELPLGSLGALLSEAGLVVNLAIAWSPSEFGQPLQVGLRFPGSTGSTTIGIQGVLALELYSLTLLDEGGYALMLNGVTVTFLKKQLPPGGAIDFALFGDPDPVPGTRPLGWYGAYRKQKDEAKPAAARRRRPQLARAARRALLGDDFDSPRAGDPAFDPTTPTTGEST